MKPLNLAVLNWLMRNNVANSKQSLKWRKSGNFGSNCCYLNMIMMIYTRNWLKTRIALMIYKDIRKSFRKLLKPVKASLKAHKVTYGSSPGK